VKMKTIAFVFIGLLILGIVVGGYYFNMPTPQDKDFFQENNIIDKVPIGRDFQGLWIYQTADNKIIKTAEYPTTEEGIVYAKLVGVNK